MEHRSRMARSVGLIAAAMLVVGAASCGSSTDDVARIMARSGQSREEVTTLLDDAARASARNSDELARLLAGLSPTTSGAASQAVDRLVASGFLESAATSIVCDILGQAVIAPGDLDRDGLIEIAVSALLGAFGDEMSAFVTATGIADDLSEGVDDPGLWARVTMLTLQYC